MASIKQKTERKFKITVCNGYRTDGTKISRAKTITVPNSVPPKRIHQYIAQAAAEMERDFQHGYSEDADSPFEAFAEKWLARQVRYAPSTLAGYRSMLRTVFPYIGSVKIRDIKPITLENLAIKLRKRQWRGKTITEATVQKYLETVSAVLQDAVRNDILSYNPAHRLRLPKPTATPQIIPSQEEMYRLLGVIARQPPNFRAYYILAMVTGCRRGELAALRWDDIKGQLLHINKSRGQITGKGILEGKTKNGKARFVTLDADTLDMLEDLYLWQTMQDIPYVPNNYIFVDRNGNPYHPDTFSKRFRRLLDENGFDRAYHLHSLRHFYATTLLNNGISNKVVADMLGHRDTSFLEKTYGHPQAEYGSAAASCITQFLHAGSAANIFQLLDDEPEPPPINQRKDDQLYA